MTKTFKSIKSGRPWPPILISHLFQQGLFITWLLLFYTSDVFGLDYYEQQLIVIQGTIKIVG